MTILERQLEAINKLSEENKETFEKTMILVSLVFICNISGYLITTWILIICVAALDFRLWQISNELDLVIDGKRQKSRFMAVLKSWLSKNA